MGLGDISKWISADLLEQKVRETLKSSGVSFSEQVPIDGYRADFVFQAPDGHKHVIEAKEWDSTPSELTRAKKLAAHLRTLPVEGSFVVLPSLKTEHPSQGLISVKGLSTILRAVAAGPSTPSVTPPAPASTKEQRIVFAAMPFAPKYDDVFFVAIRGAAKNVRISAKRVDKEDYTGDML